MYVVSCQSMPGGHISDGSLVYIGLCEMGQGYLLHSMHVYAAHNVSDQWPRKITIHKPCGICLMWVSACLSHWKICSSKYCNPFEQLWNDQNFNDVTLATLDNQQIKTHKVILRSCSHSSEIFCWIFSIKTPSSTWMIWHKVLDMVMHFIYIGLCEME